MAARVRVVEGDLADVPELPKDLDTVGTAPATYFDPPVHEAFRPTCSAPRALLERILEAGGRSTTCTSRPRTRPAAAAARSRKPRSTTSSTARPGGRGLGWREPSSTARGAPTAGQVAQKAERAPPRRPPDGRGATEAARREWVANVLRRPAPSAPAASAGPTATRSPRRSASASWNIRPRQRDIIVRPAIVESALAEPHPGWIEGFKMAEPLILAYGRGACRVPGVAGHGGRDRPGRPRRRRDLAALATIPSSTSRSTSTSARPPEPVDVPRSVRRRPRLHPRAPVRRRMTAARPAAGLAVPRRPDASSGCSSPARRRTRSPTTSSGTRRGASAPATWPASSTSRGAAWSSCAATSTSTASTPQAELQFVD